MLFNIRIFPCTNLNKKKLFYTVYSSVRNGPVDIYASGVVINDRLTSVDAGKYSCG
jgi:hypothetical protein